MQDLVANLKMWRKYWVREWTREVYEMRLTRLQKQLKVRLKGHKGNIHG